MGNIRCCHSADVHAHWLQSVTWTLAKISRYDHGITLASFRWTETWNKWIYLCSFVTWPDSSKIRNSNSDLEVMLSNISDFVHFIAGVNGRNNGVIRNSGAGQLTGYRRKFFCQVVILYIAENRIFCIEWTVATETLSNRNSPFLKSKKCVQNEQKVKLKAGMKAELIWCQFQFYCAILYGVN